nr:phosphoethanolamine--lipid A transferase [Helicobacter sp.]
MSWLSFVLLSSLFLTCMNFKLFSYIYKSLNSQGDISLFIIFPLLYFCLITSFFALLFVPYATKILLSCLIIIACISQYFMNTYGIPIDYQMLDNALKTDTKEIKELFSISSLLYCLFLICLPLLLVFKAQIEFFSLKKHLMLKFLTLFVSLSLAMIIFACFSKTLMPFARNFKEMRVFNAPFYQIYSAQKLIQLKLNSQRELTPLSKYVSLKNPMDKNLLVLVIGETARAQNFSLNSYAKNPTNLYTSSIPDIVFFPNTYACGTSTAVSLPCMFSFSTQSQFSTNEFQENILDILNKAGVTITWLDNNSGKDYGIAKRLEDSLFFTQDYDGFLIQEVKKRLETLSDNHRLIVLHLQGSHGPAYYKRVPKEFQKFLPTCETNNLSLCSSKEIYNAYDNTILYTDYILYNLIKELSELKDYKSALLYLSDHGESLGENGIYLHGMPYAFAPKTQIHIPMMFWSNDSLLNNLARANQNKKYSHDNLVHTLLGFFNAEAEGNLYTQDLDIFATNPE